MKGQSKLKPRVVGIIQARMGSTRLAGKSLMPLLGDPMLQVVVQRIRPAAELDALVVATSDQPQDDPIDTLAQRINIPTFRGSETDCLDRIYQAACHFDADIVVRLTGDNPLVEAGFVDSIVGHYLRAVPPYDFGSTGQTNYPVGLSVEVMSFEALAIAWQNTTDPVLREHVTPHLYHSGRFRVHLFEADEDYKHYRWTVDTPEDFDLIERIFGAFGHGDFDWQEALIEMEAHADWADINAHIEQKKL